MVRVTDLWLSNPYCPMTNNQGASRKKDVWKPNGISLLNIRQISCQSEYKFLLRSSLSNEGSHLES